MCVHFLKLNIIKLVIILKHLTHIRLNQLTSINVETLIIEFGNDFMDGFQFFPYLLIILTLYFDVFQMFAEISLPKFGESMQEIWGFKIIVVYQFHLLFNCTDRLFYC